MSAKVSFSQYAGDSYDSRSLKHEQHMLALYRGKAAQDASLLQPLANACWRAACFEWGLNRDADAVRRLWAEAAGVLVRGFAGRLRGFDPSPDQLVLALHLTIAARQREAFTRLAHFAPDVRANVLREARAFRGSRAHFYLAEGYTSLARALVEHNRNLAGVARQSLAAALEESHRDWWDRSFPNPLESAWLAAEHQAICTLLGAIAEALVEGRPPADEALDGGERPPADEVVTRLAATVDAALLQLQKFVEGDSDHHPKLYVWLPGVALSAMAASAGIPMDFLAERHQAHAPGYARLPLELVFP